MHQDGAHKYFEVGTQVYVIQPSHISPVLRGEIVKVMVDEVQVRFRSTGALQEHNDPYWYANEELELDDAEP